MFRNRKIFSTYWILTFLCCYIKYSTIRTARVDTWPGFAINIFPGPTIHNGRSLMSWSLVGRITTWLKASINTKLILNVKKIFIIVLHGLFWFMLYTNPNEKVCVWSCLSTLQSQMTRSTLTISLWVIYVWLCRDIVLTFSRLTCQAEQFMSDCRDFDFPAEQLSAENRPTFRRIQTGLLCRARSNIFIRELLGCSIHVDFYWRLFICQVGNS